MNDNFEGGLDDVSSNDGGGFLSSIESAWNSFVTDYKTWWSDDTPISTGGPTVFDPIIQGVEAIGQSLSSGIESFGESLIWIILVAVVLLIVVGIAEREA